MDEERVLYLYFVDEGGKRRTIKVPNPNPENSAMDIKSAMETIKEKNIFNWKIATIEKARLVSRTISDIEV